MKEYRKIYFFLLLLGIGSLITVFYQKKMQPPFDHSLTPFFVELGKPLKTLDRAITKAYPINEIHEKILGEEFKNRLRNINPSDEDLQTIEYLNKLVAMLTKESKKPFTYEVFLDNSLLINAYALPGGAITITRGLLELLESEAELIAILGHEIGHIERGHLFDKVRDQILERNLKLLNLNVFITDLFKQMRELAFSKSQEDEADEYGFRLLVASHYDPLAMSKAFKKMIHDHHSHTFFDDFFSTHPSMELREEKFRSKGKKWKEKSYVGKKNFILKVTRSEIDYSDEWKDG